MKIAWIVLCLLSCGELEYQHGKVFQIGTDQKHTWTGFGHQRNWQSELQLTSDSKFCLNWKKTVGEGYGQIVGDQNAIYVVSGQRLAGSDSKRIETRLTAYATATGRQLWQFRCESELYDDHQTMGGKQPSPQSTPLVINGRLILTTFAGDLICVNKEDGKEIWRRSTRQAFDAQAVQFGSAASPVPCPFDDQAIVVLAAGSKGGVLKLRLDDGSLVWRCPVNTFGYGTPVFASLGGVAQWIVVSRNHVISADAKTGEELWRYALQEKGLTNVPTPIVVDDSRVVVSCQSSKGTECILLKPKNGKLRAEQEWFNGKMQFFYTNWLNLNDSMVVACNHNSLNVFNNGDGKRIGRWRKFGDGNLIKTKEHLLVLGGKGELGVVKLNKQSDALVIQQKYQIGNGRFWVAPTIIGQKLFVRFEDQLLCIGIDDGSNAKPMVNQIEPGEEERLELERISQAVDPVEEIFSVFQDQGQDAALRLYAKSRKSQRLNEAHRIALSDAAKEQGLNEIAIKILRDAKEDFPDSELVLEKWQQLIKN